MSQPGVARRGRANLAIGMAWAAWLIGLAWVLLEVLNWFLGICPPYPDSSGSGEATRQFLPPGIECTYTGEHGNVLAQIPAGYGLLVGLLLVAALPTYALAHRRPKEKG